MAARFQYRVEVFPTTDADLAVCRQSALTLHVCSNGTACPLLQRLETQLNVAGQDKWELVAIVPPQYPLQCCKLVYKQQA